jgi:hypothetical protein
MFRLDKNAHKTYNLKQIQNESENYSHLTPEEKFKVFAYLQSVAYNYDLNSPPKMDKTVHSCR